MKIGVIADTHGYFDPKIPACFKGVDCILHAGDIGPRSIIAQLEQIAPVTAVLGNNDFTDEFRETELVEMGGHRIFLQHIVDPDRLVGELRGRIERAGAQTVIFGHTHKSRSEIIGGRLFFNPGYAGKQRFDLRRSIGLLRITPQGMTTEIKVL